MTKTLERIIRTSLFAGALASLSGCYNPFAYNFPDKNCYSGYREEGLTSSSTAHIDCNETTVSPDSKRVAFVNLIITSKKFITRYQTGEINYSKGGHYTILTADRNGDNEVFITSDEFKCLPDREGKVDLNWVDNKHLIFRAARSKTFNSERQIFYADACRNGKIKEINLDFDVGKIELSADKKTLKVHSGYKIYSLDTSELPSGKVHPILISDNEIIRKKK